MANLPDVSSRYGAPMGRGQSHARNKEISVKFKISRVRINSGGYDRGGAYWGIGAPLYQVSADLDNPPVGWEECGQCGGHHPQGYTAECRDDRYRWPWSTQYDYLEFYLRAHDREDAKDQVRAKYPNARFYR